MLSYGAAGAREAPSRWLARGAVAQLGERLNGIQEVRGSIPLGSIRRGLEAGIIPHSGLGWRNWQTRRIQDPVGVNPVRVRVPPRALAGSFSYAAHVLELVDRLV